MVWFHFSGFELVTKGAGIKQSMGKSKSLVAGKFWKVFARFLVFGLFGVLVQMVLSLLPFGLAGVVMPLLGALFLLPYFLLYKELSTG